MKHAVAYLRTSSATNVGEDKDSAKRQREAIQTYAERNGITIVSEFYDAGVSGADHVMDRPGFCEMFERCNEFHLADIILVENASRFSRDLIVQITGHDKLKKHGLSLVPVDAPDYFKEETPTAVMVRQILGAVSQFEKNSLVNKLRVARERRRAATGKCEGRKSHAEMNPEHVLLAQSLRKQGMTLEVIMGTLHARGFYPRPGGGYTTQSVSSMIRQKVKA